MASDHRIQQYLRGAAARERDVERVGPFVATFDVRDANPYLSYAIPDDGATPTAEDVAALTDAYVRRGRVPRLEYLPSVAPAVRRALVDAGFAVEAELPGMVCTADTLVDVLAPDGIAIAVPDADADWHGMAAAQHAAFGVPAAPEDPEAPARGRERLAAGGAALLARDLATGAIVGGGVATVPSDGVTEVAGIGVAETHRRRGIAGALTAALTRMAFAGGVEVAWLTPGHDGAHRVYARAGYADATTILHVSAPAPPAASAPDGRPASDG
jgi:GNAT superfamily N-acetyltransferase